MTRIFDLHADLGWNIQRLHKLGEKDILKNHHLSNLRKGEVLDCAAACFFSGEQSWQEMKEMITNTRNEIDSLGAKLILKPKDLETKDKDVSFILTVEGMCGIKDKVKEKVDWMYDMGVRIASLAWNDENALATGVMIGNPARGLTDKGRQVIEEMNKKKMVVDISHANEHTFWDILSISKRPIIATHSNARSLCNVRRNLTDEQIIALSSKGGIIGMNAYDAFISGSKSQKNAKGLATHAKYIADLVGVEHVACGFDFMDYYPEEHHELTNIDRATKAQNFISALKEVGFSKKDIEAIAYGNVYRFLKENL